MRACQNCGYLVPETWDTCKRCHAALVDRVPALAGNVAAGPAPASTKAATPAPAPIPPAPGAPAGGPPQLPTLPRRTVGPPLPTAAPPSGAYDQSYNLPAKIGGPIGPGGYEPPMSFAAESASPTWAAPNPTHTRTSRSSWRKVVAVLVVLVVAYGGWRVVQDRFFDHLPQGTEEYAGGGGVTYAPAGHHYQVRLPVPPVESTASDTVDGQVYTAYNALIERLPDGWEIAVGTVAIGPRPGLTDEVLDAALLSTATGMAAAANATTKQHSTITHEGYRGIDVSLDTGDGYPAKMRLFFDGSNVFYLLVHSSSGAGKLFHELTDSFHVVP